MDNIEGIKSVFPEAQVDSLSEILQRQYSADIERDDVIEFGEELLGLLEALADFEEPKFDHAGMTNDVERT